MPRSLSTNSTNLERMKLFKPYVSNCLMNQILNLIYWWVYRQWSWAFMQGVFLDGTYRCELTLNRWFCTGHDQSTARQLKVSCFTQTKAFCMSAGHFASNSDGIEWSRGWAEAVINWIMRQWSASFVVGKVNGCPLWVIVFPQRLKRTSVTIWWLTSIVTDPIKGT